MEPDYLQINPNDIEEQNQLFNNLDDELSELADGYSAQEEFNRQQVEEANQPSDVPELTPITADQQAGVEPQPELVQPSEKERLSVDQGEAAPTADLSTQEGRVQMWAEMEQWKQMPDGEEKQAIKDAWYLKYYGKTSEDHEKDLADESPTTYANESLRHLSKGSLITLAAIADLPMDLVGLIPGPGAAADDWWDKNTKFQNPKYQAARNILGAIVPVAGLTGLATKAIRAQQGVSTTSKLLKIAGADVGIDLAVTGLSDQALENNLFRQLDDAFPWFNVGDNLKTLDSDGPMMRRLKSIYAGTPFAILGNVLGSLAELKQLKNLASMDWLEPKDEIAASIKTAEQAAASAAAPEAETIIRIATIDEAVKSKSLTTAERTALQAEKDMLVNQLDELGLPSDPLESKVVRQLEAEQIEMDEAALSKLEEDPFTTKYDPVITPALARDGTVGRQAIPPGAAMRNAGDISAIRGGVEGDPTPMLSEAMMRKFLKLDGSSRNAVLGLMEQSRGKYDVIVDGVRQTSKKIDERSFDLFLDIMNTDSADELRQLLGARPRAIQPLIDGQLDYLADIDAPGVGLATRALVEQFIGRDVVNQSARAMQTAGSEIRTLSETAATLPEIVDENVVMEKVIDKLAFLMEEYGVNKYVSGWALNNKGFFNKLFRGENVEDLSDFTIREFTEAISKQHKTAMDFRKTLLSVKEENPELMRALMDAYTLSNGDVDTIAKLTNQAWKNVNPANYIVNQSGMNMFSQSLNGLVVTNLLNLGSFFNASLGATGALIQKPISGLMMGGVNAIWKRDFDEINKALYINGAWWETNRRAVITGWKTMKSINKDPSVNIDAIRRDLQFQETKEFNYTKDVAEKLWKNNPLYWGQYSAFKLTEFQQNIGQSRLWRLPNTMMSGVDAFTAATTASRISRVRAYAELADQGVEATPKNLAKAEAQIYKEMFDENGRLTDYLSSHLTGEIALNLDNPAAATVSKVIDKMPWLRTQMAFPTSGMNAIPAALSYTGLTGVPLINRIPGLNKYGAVLRAKTLDDKIKALQLHGLKDPAKEPHLSALFDELKNDYLGRIAWSAGLVTSLWGVAMAGKIRGNGAVNPNERRNERDVLNVGTKEVEINGQWYSFQGIESVETILTFLGDAARYRRELSDSELNSYMDQITWTIAATFSDKTFLKGLEPLLAIIQGDDTSRAQWLASTARPFVPKSGELSNIARAISSTRKDVYDDFIGMMQTRLPGLNTLLPEKIDIWTGKPINYNDDPISRIIQSFSPVPINSGQEPFRKWLESVGYDTNKVLMKDSTGSFEYTAEQREAISKFMGAQNLDEQIASDKFMNNKFFNTIIGKIRAARIAGQDFIINENGQKVKFKVGITPVHSAIDNLLNDAKKLAEAQLLRDPQNQGVAESILLQRTVNQRIKQGRVDEAFEAVKKAQPKLNKTQSIENFRTYGNP